MLGVSVEVELGLGVVQGAVVEALDAAEVVVEALEAGGLLEGGNRTCSDTYYYR
jgi:hypothetical protein